jgi:hypothetical protein
MLVHPVGHCKVRSQAIDRAAATTTGSAGALGLASGLDTFCTDVRTSSKRNLIARGVGFVMSP